MHQRSLLLLAIATTACTRVDDAPPPEPDPTAVARTIAAEVTIDSGPIRGAVDDDLVVFKGIPYAAPPLGALRFAPPSPVAPWASRLDAIADPPVCPQSDGQTVVGEEDCLTVNVWTHGDADHRPVMVFVHGGSGLTGGHYDAAVLARRTGNVVVTVQYRLGALGHLALPELDDAGGGNFALLDQQAALRWVQRNAAVFGGDPARVMLFGESEGGHYTCVHTVAPASAGLFASAISESGSCAGLPRRADTYATWEAGVVANVGCTAGDRLACLRAAAPTALVTGTTQPFMRLVVDGDAIPLDPADAWHAGAFAHVPLIVGTNQDESNLWLAIYAVAYPWLTSFANTEAGYKLAVWTLYPDQAFWLLAMYPYARYGSGLRALGTMTTDISFACPVREWARAWSSAGGEVGQYEFVAHLRGAYSLLGTPHALELLYVFGMWSLVPGYTANADELALSDWMQDTWGNFAATGQRPVEWPAYDRATDRHLEIGSTRVVRAGFRGGRCGALVQLGLVQGL